MNTFFDTLRGLGFQRGPKRLVAGIGGGIAHTYGINVWLVRLLIVLASFLPIIGVGAYLVVWILTPWQDGRIPLEQSMKR